MAIRKKLALCQGQSTIEFVVVFPVLLIIAVVAVNAMLFFGDCAAFDRCARQSIRAVAASPGYGQSVGASVGQIQEQLEAQFDKEYQEAHVTAGATSGGLTTFTATLEFYPTLFGMGLKREVLGVSLPSLSHSVDLTVWVYKPGVVL